MKYLVALLVAALTMVSMAGAWEDFNKVSYTYQKGSSVQDGILPFNHIYSGAFFDQSVPASGSAPGTPDPYGDVSGEVMNQLLSTTIDGRMGSTQQTLTQGGMASANLLALDSQDKKPEITLNLAKSQEYTFSGVATGVSAKLEDFGFVGVAGDSASAQTSPFFLKEATNWNAANDDSGNPQYTGEVEADGSAKLSEVNIGQAASSSATKDLYTGVTAVSGQSTAWAGFDNAMVPDFGAQNGVETSAWISTGHWIANAVPVDVGNAQWENGGFGYPAY